MQDRRPLVERHVAHVFVTARPVFRGLSRPHPVQSRVFTADAGVHAAQWLTTDRPYRGRGVMRLQPVQSCVDLAWRFSRQLGHERAEERRVRTNVAPQAQCTWRFVARRVSVHVEQKRARPVTPRAQRWQRSCPASIAGS